MTDDPKHGYFEIGVFAPKTSENIGTLWRSAYQLGASGLFVIGARYKTQPTDTVFAERHVPIREYDDFSSLNVSRPKRSVLVGIEIGGRMLAGFHHPEQAIYLLGSEDKGLPNAVRSACHSVITIESARTASYNVAVAGSIVMYHRMCMYHFERKV